MPDTKMLLAIDVGNTNTVFGVYARDQLVRSWRLSTLRERTVDEYGVLVRNLFALEGLEVSSIRSVIVASVVPPLDSTVAEMIERYFATQATFVSAENAGIPVLYDDPREVGADRIVDAVAVLERYGSPAIVVDLGTATTFDAITRNGEYQGGLIAPGIEISAAALIDRAAKLPRIDIRKPQTLIGTSTADSLQSGFFWGYVSLVDGIVDRMKAELGDDAEVIGTGGMAHFIKGESRQISRIDINLTLDGLYLVARRLGTV
jgi:type III pantothenate kinase